RSEPGRAASVRSPMSQGRRRTRSARPQTKRHPANSAARCDRRRWVLRIAFFLPVWQMPVLKLQLSDFRKTRLLVQYIRSVHQARNMKSWPCICWKWRRGGRLLERMPSEAALQVKIAAAKWQPLCDSGNKKLDYSFRFDASDSMHISSGCDALHQARH